MIQLLNSTKVPSTEVLVEFRMTYQQKVNVIMMEKLSTCITLQSFISSLFASAVSSYLSNKADRLSSE